jgi:hypothetical protein
MVMGDNRINDYEKFSQIDNDLIPMLPGRYGMMHIA